MKKNFCLLLLVMLFSFVASAQRFEYQLGLKGGLGIGFLVANDDDIVSKDDGFNYKFGLTGIYYFGENYGFVSGFNVIGNKISYKYKIIDFVDQIMVETIEDRNINNTYFQIPIMLKMRTDPIGDIVRIFGEIGYGLNILAAQRDKGDFDHPYRDVCSSLIVHLGAEVEVLNRSTLQFMIAYDDFFSNMMSKGNNKMTVRDLCLEIGFLF